MFEYRAIFNNGCSIKVFAHNLQSAKNEAKRIRRAGNKHLHSFIKSIYRIGNTPNKMELALDRLNR